MAQKDRERELNKNEEKRKSSSLKRYPFPVKRILLSCDSGENVGMKIIGGVSLPYAKDCGAIVKEISPGGIADTLGQVKEGDQILEWNGITLSGKSAMEVQSIVTQSKGEIEVVLRDRDTVRRRKPSVDLNGNDSRDKSHSPHRLQANGVTKRLSGSSEAVDTDIKKRKWSLPLGQVQLLVCHDVRAHILYVTVLRARGLQTRKPDGDSRPEPFIKCKLLPGGVELQRRTRVLSCTSNPEWHQTMVYEGISPDDLRCHKLEVSAWHFQSGQNQRHEFLGELLLDLGDQSVVDEQPHWYNLQDNAEGLTSMPRSRPPVPHTVLNGKDSVVTLGRRNTQSVSLLHSTMTPGQDGMAQPGCHGSMCCIF